MSDARKKGAPSKGRAPGPIAPTTQVKATVEVRFRATPGEREALHRLVAAWTDERAASSAGARPPESGTLFLRAKIRELAADAGHPVPEDA